MPIDDYHCQCLGVNDGHAHLRRCPQASAITTGERLRTVGGLSHVRIVPIELLDRAAWAKSSDKFSTDLGAAGAVYLGRELENAVVLGDMQDLGRASFKIGVSGGRSIFGLFSALGHLSFKEASPRSETSLKVIIEPLVVGPVPHSLYSAMSIAELAAQKFDSAVVLDIWEQRVDKGEFWLRLKRVVDRPDERRALDWLVVGIGAKGSGSFHSHIGAVYQHGDRDPLRVADNAIGDICSRVFDKTGRELDEETGNSFVQVDLLDLQTMARSGSKQRVIAVAGGKNKVEAIATVLKKKPHLINSLVTDELTAHSLIARLEAQSCQSDDEGPLDMPM
jgi:DNA-binding transcriptional regulator LsrR (DeoR family)